MELLPCVWDCCNAVELYLSNTCFESGQGYLILSPYFCSNFPEDFQPRCGNSHFRGHGISFMLDPCLASNYHLPIL